MEFYEVIASRRSTRKFLSDDVDNQKILNILTAASMAPSAGNVQPWSFVVVRNKEAISWLGEVIKKTHAEYFGNARKVKLEGEKLERVSEGYKRMENAPVYVIVCKNVKERLLEDDYEAWENKWLEQSVAAAMENFTLAATAEGLATCWLGAPLWYEEEIKEMFNIPKEVEIFAISPVGYANGGTVTRNLKDVSEIVHFEKW